MKLNPEQEKAVSHFNGPCVVTAVPGSGKCVSGDTLITSPDMVGECKLSYIRDNLSKSVISLSKESLNESSFSNRACYFVDSGRHVTIKIQTDQGFSLEGTPHHPIAVLNKHGYLEWKTLDSIRCGDVCPIWTNKNYHPTLRFSPKFYLMGLLIGDGYLGREYFAFTSEKNNVSDEFCRIIEDSYGFKVSSCKDKRRKNLFTFGVYRKNFTKQLKEEFGDIQHLACEKYLTPQILRGSLSDISSLISGIFDTDGYVCGNSIGLTMCSSRLIDQLHILLLRYGVFASKKEKVIKGRTHFSLFIFGDDYRRFVSNIGFRHSLKNQKSKMLSNARNPNKVIPNCKHLIQVLRDKVRNRKWWVGRDGRIASVTDSVCLSRYAMSTSNSRCLTDLSVKRIVDICAENGYSSSVLRHLTFLSDNFTFVTITGSTANSETETEVYDYSVPKTHNFIANGFIVHNTRVLTQRVVHLIKHHHISPKNILCTTFTNKAANEMRERVAAEVGEFANEIFINTFHGLALAILRKYPALAGLSNPFSIYTETDQIDLMSKVARMQGYEMTRDDAERLSRIVNDYREEIHNCESCVVDLPQDERDVLNGYMKIIDELNAVDFSGILYKCWKVIANPKIVEVLSERFKYIMVDEAQDMNNIQYDITKRIGIHANLFYVGDYHQSIFSWRGARPDNLLDLKKDFPTVNEITLPRNYRSTTDILKCAQRLIRCNEDGKNVVLISEKGDGYPVSINAAIHDEDEADGVVNRIQKLRSKYRWKDFAILYRASHLSRVMEQKLRMSGIPYKIVGGFSFYDRKEIKTALSYLQLLTNPNDTVAFARAISEPKRGVGDVAVGRIEKYCHENGKSVFDACSKIEEIDGITPKSRASVKEFIGIIGKFQKRNAGNEPIAKIATDLVDAVGYSQYLKNCVADKDRQRLDSLDELYSNMAEYSDSQPNARIGDYLQAVLVSTPDTQDEDQENVVSMLTMHSAKGLEFPVVFIIGCEDKIIPHYRAVSERGVGEERRLMYVAITRAQSYLFLTHRKVKRVIDKKTGRNNFFPVNPSPFLIEINPKYTV